MPIASGFEGIPRGLLVSGNSGLTVSLHGNAHVFPIAGGIRNVQ